MIRLAAVAATFVAATVTVTGCSSSKQAASAGSSPAPTTDVPTSGQSCAPAKASDAWPALAPAGLPVPKGLHIVSVQRKPNAVIRFTVPDDFHTTVRYLLDALPAAGFTLGTGDSEAEEADIPLSRGNMHASIKVNDAGTCLTDGLLALAAEQ